MKGFVVRTCLLIDFLLSIPVFVLLIFVDPNRYAETMAQSGETIRARMKTFLHKKETRAHGG